MLKFSIIREEGLWISHFPTNYGPVELLCGEADAPDLSVILLVEKFFDGNIDHIAAVRGSVFSFPRFWRPIRIAVNDKGRLGLQFKNRFSGQQEGMFFADEHSLFHTILSEISVEAQDRERLLSRELPE